jgi:hypothetical protein
MTSFILGFISATIFWFLAYIFRIKPNLLAKWDSEHSLSVSALTRKPAHDPFA